MLSDYQNYLDRLPISQHTRRNYLRRVKQYMTWLDAHPDASKALTDSVERDFFVKEFKCSLLQKGRAANTVNSSLAALDNYFLFIGIGQSKVKRQDLPKQAPRALGYDEQRRFLKAVSSCKSLRNRTIATVMLNCGLRISEVVQLNVADIVLTARMRQLTVRCGKGNKHRTVPINKEAGDILQLFVAGRMSVDREQPLFVSCKGTRLSTQSIDHLIRSLGKDSGVELSSHTLRHSFITQLVRNGVDVVAVAEPGHSRLETTRRYSLPSQDVIIKAVERLNYAAAK
jgi:site-specific recombinase XerD